METIRFRSRIDSWIAVIAFSPMLIALPRDQAGFLAALMARAPSVVIEP